MKDVYKCASMDTGDECVVMVGVPQRLWLCVGSCLERTHVRDTPIITLCHIPCTHLMHLFCTCFPHTYYAVAVPLYIFGHDPGSIMLYNVNCTGSSSTRLVDCSYQVVQGSSSGGCSINLSQDAQDASARCYGMLPWWFGLSIVMHQYTELYVNT